MDNPVCPECKGRKKVGGLGSGPKISGWIEITCDFCQGSGKATPDQIVWRKRGDAMRVFRLARDESIGELARRIGVSAVTISDMERGKIEPSLDVGGSR